MGEVGHPETPMRTNDKHFKSLDCIYEIVDQHDTWVQCNLKPFFPGSLFSSSALA